jgi:hypothetical protein
MRDPMKTSRLIEQSFKVPTLQQKWALRRQIWQESRVRFEPELASARGLKRIGLWLARWCSYSREYHRRIWSANSEKLNRLE